MLPGKTLIFIGCYVKELIHFIAMKRLAGIILCLGFGYMLTAQVHDFNPEHIGCACNKQISHLRLENNPESSGLEMDQKYNRFEWFIDPAVLYISGAVTSVHVLNEDTDQVTFDLSSALTVDSVMYHGQTASYLHAGNVLTIMLPQTVMAGSLDSVSVYYQGVPQTGSGFGSFVQGSHAGIPIIWTLSEPYGCSDWWPCKNGLTDKIDSIDVIVTSPMPHRTASNGLLVNEWVEDGNRTCHWKHRYPIVPYLVAIAITDYGIYSDWISFENDSIEVLNYVFPSQMGTIQNQTPGLIPIMELFNNLLEPYPFILEKYGHAQFGWGGGMEHQTMSFMGSFGHELMAHELAHSWFGNKITTGSWADIWINEGFATYLTGITYEHMFDGFYWMPWKQQNINWVTSQPGGSVFVDDTTSVSRIFNSRLSYSKGALVLHTLRWIIGDEAFYQALHDMLNSPQHAYKFMVTAELITFFEQASGMDLTYFFDQWFYGQGYPSYIIQYQTFAETEATVTLYQSQSHSSVPFFHLPVPIRLSAPGNDTLIVLNNTFSGQTFAIDPGFVPTSIEFDPDLWLISKNNQVIIGIGEVENNSQVKIFPNPAADIFYIESQWPVNAISFIAADGKMVQAKEFVQTYGNLYQVDVESLAPGFWVVRVEAGEQVMHQKIMISR